MSQSHHPLATFISDCEGPITRNDNAFELTAHFVPKGAYLFTLISKYDDVLAEVIQRPGYKAGYTLSLITPFLKAHGVTNKKAETYSAQNIVLVHGAREMLQRVRGAMPSFIVSTSYQQYIFSLCTLVGFPQENVYCTKLNLDQYALDDKEIAHLKQVEKEIVSLPMIEIPRNAKSLRQLAETSQDVVKQLDGIFCNIAQMAAGSMLKEVKPMGGDEKSKAVTEISEKVRCKLEGVMYVGDSITDVQAFQLVKQSGGLTVSFNGNEYAVKHAEVVVLTENAVITSVLANVFSRSGKEDVHRLVEEWSRDAITKYCHDTPLLQELFTAYPEALPTVQRVTSKNRDTLAEESSQFRKTVRGDAIGKLG